MRSKHGSSSALRLVHPSEASNKSTMIKTSAFVPVLLLLASFGCGGAQPAAASPPPSVMKTSPPSSSPPPAISSSAAVPPPKQVEAQGPEAVDPEIPDGPANELGASEIEILVKKLPLRVEVLNFEGVDKFLLLYAPFSSNKKLVRGTRRYFRNARSLLLNEPAVFSLNSGASGIIAMLAPPKPGESPYGAFLVQMQGGLQAVRSVLLEFQAHTEEKLSEEQESRLNAQVGGSNSIVESNINTIATLINRLVESTKSSSRYSY